ncbi:hypothetical protein AB7M42_006846 [Bradyrhizobium diazoefficiens]
MDEMLDPDHGHAGSVDRGDKFEELADFGIRQPARDFVEQQQPGFCCERSGQFESLALEQGQTAGGCIAEMLDAAAMKRFPRLLLCLLAVQGGSEGSRHQRILEYGHTLERLRDLKRPADAGTATRVGSECGDVFSVKQDRSGIAAQIAGDQTEQSGLARSVRSDDTDEFACPNLKRQARDHDHVAIALADVPQFEQRCHCRQLFSSSSLRSALISGAVLLLVM